MNRVNYLRRLDTVNGILNQMSRPCRVLLLLCVMPVKRKPLEGPPFNLYKTSLLSSLWRDICIDCFMKCTRARFTNGFLPAIQIRWKLRLAVIPLLAIRSRQTFAHATTAQLSCHVQNFVAITVLESMWEWNTISIEFELRWKKRYWNGALVKVESAWWLLLVLHMNSCNHLRGKDWSLLIITTFVYHRFQT